MSEQLNARFTRLRSTIKCQPKQTKEHFTHGAFDRPVDDGTGGLPDHAASQSQCQGRASAWDAENREKAPVGPVEQPAGESPPLEEVLKALAELLGKEEGQLLGAFGPSLPGTVASILADLGIAVAKSPLGQMNAILARSADAITKAAADMRLTPDEQREGLANLANEVVSRAPQIVAALFVVSSLPVIGARAAGHFRHTCGESHHDATDLSQSVVLKILRAVTGTWPRGNVGAWISTICQNVHVDHLRKGDQHRRAMDRLEKAAKRMRD